MALPRINRLKNKKDFQEAFKKGKGFGEDFLFLKILKRKSGPVRFGFIVTKKASKKAVIRNRIRRKLNEAIRTRLSKIEKGWDGIFVVSRPFPEKNVKEIEKTAVQLLRKAKLI